MPANALEGGHARRSPMTDDNSARRGEIQGVNLALAASNAVDGKRLKKMHNVISYV